MEEPTIDDQEPTRKSNANAANSASRETSYHPLNAGELIEPSSSLVNVPEKIAEFEVRQLLGRGGFGSVYEAYDTILQRQVAIKIPHRFPNKGSQEAAPDLREARAIASLEHPHIVAVYQAASTPEVPLYIVVRLIHGKTLGQWAAEVQPSFAQIAGVIASIASALGYAHAQNVVHRDVKPGNILVDNEGRAYVTDFGLALREFDLDCGPAYVGTPAYMSPEQARGEGHRVDGRSDIFSLGVVLYELLTGTRPFRGSANSTVLNEIKSVEPKHPCQVNPRVPAELARVCLRALNKSLSGRYQRAEELAIELDEYCRASLNSGQPSQSHVVPTTPSSASSMPTSEVSPQPPLMPVVPKGLRAFEADDADFFLRLLPGPYDRHGLPNSIRFWKARLESRSPSEAFSVGVVYGPSGCGKTSMFRAGLLPRLSRDLQVIYIQATAADTEQTLLNSLTGFLAPTVASNERNLAAAQDDDIVRTFAKIRRQGGRKVVICIDQFEQWLYGHSSDLEQAPLAQALRHCDGINLQCVLMVRDDFWMGISRLMQALDIPISENQNASSVDLFDKQHARNVLAMFGTALGRLPANEAKWTQREHQFLTSAINYLAVDGRVICVQLALLAEMMKHRDWNKAALFSQDGGSGIGVSFFEQTFEADSAPRRYRNHCEGAQRLLRKLLPDPGNKIKGAIQSESELREAVGYTDEKAFRELLRILDAELHLVTPTSRLELDGYISKAASGAGPSDDETGYQLTHDFLISPLRKWLTMRRLTTRIGQSQARMEEYSELYRARPNPQSLPTLIEYLQMRWWLRTSSLTDLQRRMLHAAGRHYAWKTGAWVLGMTVLASIGVAWQSSSERNHREIVQQREADTLIVASLPEAVQQMQTFRPEQTQLWSVLGKYAASETLSPEKRLRAAMALAMHSTDKSDSKWHTFLLDRYLQSTAPDAVVLCRTPLYSQSLLNDAIEKQYRERSNPSQPVQLRLAALLVQNPRYRATLLQDPQRLVQLLVAENPLHLNEWIDVFMPVGTELLPTLETALLASAESGGLETVNLANLISRYAVRQPELLARLVAKVGPTAHQLLVRALNKIPDANTALKSEINQLAIASQDYWNPSVAGTDWWNDPARAPEPLTNFDASALEAKWKTHGVYASDRFLVMLQVSPDDLKRIVVELQSTGFRVAALSPYGTLSQPQAMVLWKRDGRASEWAWPATKDELKQLNDEHQKREHFIADLAEYSPDDYQSTRFACVWTDSPPLSVVTETGMYLDVPVADHETAGWRDFLDRGFVPRIGIQSEDRAGNEYFTSLRWKLASDVSPSDEWNEKQRPLPTALEQLRPNDVLVDAHLTNRSQGQNCGLTHVWWSNIPADSTWSAYAESSVHLERCAELAKQGYRPVSIHARRDGSEPTKFSSVWWRPHADLMIHSKLGRQHARLAVALHKNGDHEALRAALASSQADIRGAIVDTCAEYKADPHWLVEQLCDSQRDLAARRAAAHALVLVPTNSLSAEVMNLLSAQWTKLVASTEDPGLRSAIESLHRAWKLNAPLKLPELPGRELQTRDGKRLVVLQPPPVMIMGSPSNEPGRDGRKESRKAIRMPRAFAMSVTEVTAAEFLLFAENHQYAEDYCPTTDCPMIDVTWFDAARYCRWLSDEEGIDESEKCYPPLDQIRPGMKLETGYLNRTGYRLPTEAEWEFAARGGFREGRHFGFLPELLGRYAWITEKASYRAKPVGSLLPNDYGLFDIFGNAMEMCQNPMLITEYGQGSQSDPAESHLVIAHRDNMASRGGAILFQPLDARAAHRDDHPAGESRPYLSFRIVRTVRR